MSSNYSFLMSVYIGEEKKFLIKSIESMLNQTIPPEQIVIVKDGPLKKEVESLINCYENKYKNVFTVVSLNKNMGLGYALAIGLKYCRNQLVARMDSDDISIKDRIESQLQEFQKDDELSICGGFIEEIHENGEISLRKVPLEMKEIKKFSRKRSPFNHVTVMFKKNDVLEVGNYRNVNRKEDYDLFMRLLNSGFKGLNIEKSLVYVKADKNYLKRRKSLQNCMSYVGVSKSFFKQGYITLFDYLFVVVTQFFIYISPIWLFSFISKRILRD